MNRSLIARVAVLVTICSMFLLAQEAPTGEPTPGQAQLDPAQKRLVDAALPQEAPAKPKKHRLMLITNLTMKDGHPFKSPSYDTFPVLDYMMEQMGKKAGAYDVVVSNDIEMFRPDKIKQFDAICFCNSSGVLFDDPSLRASLLAYVRNGGGIVGIHDALATFVQWPVYDQWPPFGQMMGGTENGGHPWNMVPVAMKVDDPGNPINAVFRGQSDIKFTMQVFQLQQPSLRDHMHVLFSVDVDKMAPVPVAKVNPQRKTDLDFPVSWIRREGKGRVYYNAMGHDSAPFWNPVLLQHYLAGVQYAMGDLKADDSPDRK